MIADFVRSEIKAMAAVDWGNIPDDSPYRLLWGENQQLRDEVTEAIVAEAKKVNLYPSATKQVLRRRIADYCNLMAENILATNGSDEALELIAKVFLAAGDEVIVPAPSYPCFSSVSQMMGACIREVPLESDFSWNVDRIVAQVTKRTKVIWLANPNNPTGNLLLDRSAMQELLDRTDCIVVCDECYFEVSGVTVADMIEQYPRLIVTRSFSKVFALAGARLGYTVASPEVLLYLNRLQQTNQVFSVNRFAQAAGSAVLNNPEKAAAYCQSFIQAKARFEQLLQKSPLQILPTLTTFSFIKLPSDVSSETLRQTLAASGVLVKDCSIYKGLGKEYICMGIPAVPYQEACTEAVEAALRALREP